MLKIVQCQHAAPKNAKCKRNVGLDLTGERQQQLHATHAVSPIATTLQVLPVSCLECDLFRPITRPSGCLPGASLVVERLSRLAAWHAPQRTSSPVEVASGTAAEPCARELRLRMPTMCFQLGRLPALDGQSPETGDDVCRGAPVCLQSPSTECAAPEACNAHYHATLQHSLPLRPRQQAPGHADLRQWQCRVSVQRETATSDDNLSNLRCWRNAGAHKQSPGPLATLE